MKLGFIGTGKIASSVITGICKSKIRFKQIIISPRNKIIANNLKKNLTKLETKEIQNIKDYIVENITPRHNKQITSKILNTIINYETLDIKLLRNNIYDIFTYNLCVKTCIKDIVFGILKVFKLSNENIKKILIKKIFIFIKKID